MVDRIYPDHYLLVELTDKFFRGITYLLKDNGYFFYADFRGMEHLKKLHQ